MSFLAAPLTGLALFTRKPARIGFRGSMKLLPVLVLTRRGACLSPTALVPTVTSSRQPALAKYRAAGPLMSECGQ